jgi:hypothetical protein
MDVLVGLRSGRRPLKAENAGSNPAEDTVTVLPGGRATGLQNQFERVRLPPPSLDGMGVSSNGKTAGLHPANEGSIPSTVH